MQNFRRQPQTDLLFFQGRCVAFIAVCMILVGTFRADAQTDSLPQTDDSLQQSPDTLADASDSLIGTIDSTLTDSLSGDSATADLMSPDSTSTAALPAPHLNTSSTPTLLSGSLPDQLRKDQSPYYVEADIFISPGSTVSIEAGVVILFNNFTGLHVQGSLFTKGTTENPVVFTSINDQEYNSGSTVNAAPYDWNGIDVYESAIGTEFTNCIVRYSVYGIRSQTTQLRIRESRFLQNGKSNVSVKDSTFSIDTNTFSFNPPSQEPAVSGTISTAAEGSQQRALNKAIAPPPGRSEKNRLRGFFRYSGMVLAAVGIAAVIQEYDDFTQAKNEFQKLDQMSEDNMQKYTSSDWNRAHDHLRKETYLTGAYAGTGMIGLVMFGLSFTF